MSPLTERRTRWRSVARLLRSGLRRILKPAPASRRAAAEFSMSTLTRLRLGLLPANYHTSAPLLGRRIELTDPYWYLHMHREILEDQVYRFAAGRPDPLVIDCGANIGVSVIYFKLLYPQARIVALEPDPEIFQVLERNVVAFEIANVTLHQRAVWSSEARLAFRPDGSVGGRLAGGQEGRNLISVQTVRLRDFLDGPVDLLKIDIEGAEQEVIADCRDVLSNVDHLFVEYHSEPGRPQALHDILETMAWAGFRYHVQDANPIRHPFLADERNPYFDLQLNVFGFRDYGCSP